MCAACLPTIVSMWRKVEYCVQVSSIRTHHLHACEETDEQCERQRIYEAGTVLPVPGNATEGVAFVAHHQLLPPTTTNQMLPIFVAQRPSPHQLQSQSQMVHVHHVRFFRTFANLISQRDNTIPASTVPISFLKLFSRSYWSFLQIVIARQNPLSSFLGMSSICRISVFQKRIYYIKTEADYRPTLLLQIPKMFFFSKCLIPTISAVTSTGTARTALLSWRPVETASDSSTLTTHSPSSRYTFFSVCLIVSLLVFVFFPWICLACVFLDALTPKTQSRYIGIPENAVLRRKPTFTFAHWSFGRSTVTTIWSVLLQFGQCCADYAPGLWAPAIWTPQWD